MFLGYNNPELCISVNAFVLHLGKITELRKSSQTKFHPTNDDLYLMHFIYGPNWDSSVKTHGPRNKILLIFVSGTQ